MESLDVRRERALEDFAGRVRTALGQRLVDLRLFGSVARGDAIPTRTSTSSLSCMHRLKSARASSGTSSTSHSMSTCIVTCTSRRVLTDSLLNDPGQMPFLKAIQRESVAL